MTCSKHNQVLISYPIGGSNIHRNPATTDTLQILMYGKPIRDYLVDAGLEANQTNIEAVEANFAYCSQQTKNALYLKFSMEMVNSISKANKMSPTDAIEIATLCQDPKSVVRMANNGNKAIINAIQFDPDLCKKINITQCKECGNYLTNRTWEGHKDACRSGKIQGLEFELEWHQERIYELRANGLSTGNAEIEYNKKRAALNMLVSIGK